MDVSCSVFAGLKVRPSSVDRERRIADAPSSRDGQMTEIAD
jgi:hypothetical protein